MVSRNRVVISGGLGSGEVWSTGINFALDGGGSILDPEDLNAWAAELIPVMTTVRAGELGELLSAEGTIRQIDIYGYGPGPGPALGQGGTLVPAPNSGTRSSSCPYSTACVFSLETGLAGRSFKGRNYWPAIGAIVAQGTFNNPSNFDLAPQWSQMLEQISQAAPAGAGNMGPVVHSIQLDVVTPVTGVLVGAVPDTMRSRRDALQEDYQRAAYPLP